MPEAENRVADYLNHPDDNSRRFHLGDAPQAMPPIDEATEEEELTLKQHRAQIHAPDSRSRPRFRDADGEPVETSPLGLAFDEESGELLPTDDEGKVIRPTAGETRRSARRGARASTEAPDAGAPDEADTDDEDEDEADKDAPKRPARQPAPAPQGPAQAPTSGSRPTGAR